MPVPPNHINSHCLAKHPELQNSMARMADPVPGIFPPNGISSSKKKTPRPKRRGRFMTNPTCNTLNKHHTLSTTAHRPTPSTNSPSRSHLYATICQAMLQSQFMTSPAPSQPHDSQSTPYHPHRPHHATPTPPHQLMTSGHSQPTSHTCAGAQEA
ncbi:hypothetical protein BT67DRAFT_81671 [Trichocladium antarcticum]|uniref:Uncharacterized protein n=1 Tax=Trichocladium antarcticum TaxID=1450529 RepID=A0AAN6ZBW2_9PEZI|nr:hypothetical protein BT67DRAFT_81671 [Trichocladium antarcticum]